jgi:hypothetical protein
MSSDEEALAVGRIVAEHQQVKSRYAALRSKGEHLGKAIEHIGSSLQYGHPIAQETDLTVLDAEYVRAHSADLASTYARLRELESRLAELGLSPKSPDR